MEIQVSAHTVTSQPSTQSPIHSKTHSVDEEILWLQISMKNVSTVTESEAFQQLIHEGLHRRRAYKKQCLSVKRCKMQTVC